MNTGIMLNEDNSHFFFTRGGSEITEAVIDSFVDQYADTVRALWYVLHRRKK